MTDESQARRMPQGSDAVRKSVETTEAVRDGQDRYIVPRDDGRPFSFSGTLVGYGPSKVINQIRGTKVEIFVTKAGKIITYVHQWQKDGPSPRERHAAAVHTTPMEAHDWLVGDGGGKLGTCSREAWDMACKRCALFSGLDVEEVE